jgi:methyl-accepting chemotaxis protein
MPKLNAMKLGQRLTLGFSVVLALVGVMSCLSWYSLQESQAEVGSIVSAMGRANAADRWKALTQLNVSRALAIAKSGNNADLKTYFAPYIKETSAQIDVLQKKLESSASSSGDKALFVEIADKRKKYIATRDDVFSLLDAGDAAAKTALESRLLPAAESYVGSVGDFELQQQRIAEAVVAESNRQADRARMATLLLAALCASIGALFARLITRSITRPLKRALGSIGAIADGDLSHPVEVEGRDELGSLLAGLQKMQESLRRLVGGVHSSTESIRIASQEVALGSQDLSVRTEQSAASLQETASSMEQISATVRHTADAVQTADELAVGAAHAATNGSEIVSRMMTTMDQITAHSTRIGDIIGVIDGIAFQTNILALNAAVEAARAGEQGRGFAVVASEVRSLAQRSAEAAKEIRVLISASAETVESGSLLVKTAGASMTEINQAVRRVSDIVEEIRLASSEQANGVSQVNVAVSLLDRSTQQNAALVEETAAAAESLKEQAVRLSQAA